MANYKHSEEEFRKIVEKYNKLLPYAKDCPKILWIQYSWLQIRAERLWIKLKLKNCQINSKKFRDGYIPFKPTHIRVDVKREDSINQILKQFNNKITRDYIEDLRKWGVTLTEILTGKLVNWKIKLGEGVKIYKN